MSFFSIPSKSKCVDLTAPISGLAGPPPFFLFSRVLFLRIDDLGEGVQEREEGSCLSSICISHVIQFQSKFCFLLRLFCCQFWDHRPPLQKVTSNGRGGHIAPCCSFPYNFDLCLSKFSHWRSCAEMYLFFFLVDN